MAAQGVPQVAVCPPTCVNPAEDFNWEPFQWCISMRDGACSIIICLTFQLITSTMLTDLQVAKAGRDTGYGLHASTQLGVLNDSVPLHVSGQGEPGVGL